MRPLEIIETLVAGCVVPVIEARMLGFRRATCTTRKGASVHPEFVGKVDG